MRRRAPNGFSLTELMVVTGIIVLLAAIATPTLLRSIRTYQLESSGRQIGNMILRARYEAMQRNQRVCAAFARVGGEARYGLEPGNEVCDVGAPTVDTTGPFVVTPNVVQWFNNDNPTLPPLGGLPAGYNTAATAMAPASYRVTFSPRGTVVTSVGGVWSLATQVQMISLVRNTPGDFDAVLVTVTPVGRIKLYRWRIYNIAWEEL